MLSYTNSTSLSHSEHWLRKTITVDGINQTHTTLKQQQLTFKNLRRLALFGQTLFAPDKEDTANTGDFAKAQKRKKGRLWLVNHSRIGRAERLGAEKLRTRQRWNDDVL